MCFYFLLSWNPQFTFFKLRNNRPSSINPIIITTKRIIPTIASAAPKGQSRALKNLSTIKLPQTTKVEPPSNDGIANSPKTGTKTSKKPV